MIEDIWVLYYTDCPYEGWEAVSFHRTEAGAYKGIEADKAKREYSFSGLSRADQWTVKLQELRD